MAIGYFLENLFKFLIIYAIIVFIIYLLTAIFLNKFNKLVYGKGTAMAWLPIFNIYLLGKLTINKLVGWILVIGLFLTSSYTTTINGVETTHTILPKGISSTLSMIEGLVVLCLFIYAIIKYKKLKKEAGETQQTTATQYVQQPMPQQPMPQQPLPQQQPQAPQNFVDNQGTNPNSNNY